MGERQKLKAQRALQRNGKLLPPKQEKEKWRPVLDLRRVDLERGANLGSCADAFGRSRRGCEQTARNPRDRDPARIFRAPQIEVVVMLAHREEVFCARLL